MGIFRSAGIKKDQKEFLFFSHIGTLSLEAAERKTHKKTSGLTVLQLLHHMSSEYRVYMEFIIWNALFGYIGIDNLILIVAVFAVN